MELDEEHAILPAQGTPGHRAHVWIAVRLASVCGCVAARPPANWADTAGVDSAGTRSAVYAGGLVCGEGPRSSAASVPLPASRSDWIHPVDSKLCESPRGLAR